MTEQVLLATLFPTLKNPAGRPLSWSWDTFCTLLAEPPTPWRADDRLHLPLVKLGRYAHDTRAEQSPLLTITGVEGDYDAGEIDPAEAATRLAAAGVQCVVATTARHTPQAPRWRVFAPLARQHPAADRKTLLDALNGALGGVLAPESWTDKQAYFIGCLSGSKHYRCLSVDGARLDTLTLPSAPPVGKASAPAPTTDEMRAMQLAGNAAAWPENRAMLLSALASINPGCTYRVWMEVSAALYFASGGAALIDWLAWCAKSVKYPGDDEAQLKWKQFGAMTAYSAGTLYHHAGETGWSMQSQHTVDQVADPDSHCTPIVSLADCLHNWIWLSGSSSVVLRERNNYMMKWPNVLLTYVASQAMQPDVGIRQRKATIDVAHLWHRHRQRTEREEVTYMPGLPQFCDNPAGAKSFNLWAPTLRHVPRSMQVVDTFLRHVEYLVPEPKQREHFLMWLAHAEQHPGQLPTAHWLMITRAHGVGRNWLSALLAKVWPQQVALNVDLPHIFQSGFNQALSRRIFACVDEIKVDGTLTARDRFSTSLNAMLTAQMNFINVKYGNMITESNCCRWLLLSNSESAVPLTAGDRRLNVVRNPKVPRTADYYQALYGALEDPEFINAVGYYLRTLDISTFDHGARAVDSEMKRVVVSVGRDEIENAIDAFCAEWPSAIAPADALRDYVAHSTGLVRDKLRQISRILQNTEAEALVDRLTLPGGKSACVMTRDTDIWRSASHADKVAECERGMAEWRVKHFGPMQ